MEEDETLCAINPQFLKLHKASKYDSASKRFLIILMFGLQKLTSSRNRFTISPFLPIMLPTSCKEMKKKENAVNVVS